MFSALLHVTHICHTLIINMDITQGCDAWMMKMDVKQGWKIWMFKMNVTNNTCKTRSGQHISYNLSFNVLVLYLWLTINISLPYIF
jgi:hypothetical protein